MTNIIRSTQVVSISLTSQLASLLDQSRKSRGLSRSAFIASLIKSSADEGRWQQIYNKGRNTAIKFGITSEDDIDRIIHGR